MSFSLDIGRFIDRFVDRRNDAVRVIALEVLKGTVLKTPVDTGRLRGAWQVGINVEPAGNPDGVDPAGGPTIARGQAALAQVDDRTDAIWITNNLPYAEVVELGLYPGDGPKTVGGFSRQAPQGMLRVTLEEVQASINDLLNRLGG